MTLPAFAAVRHAAGTLLLSTSACYRLISHSCIVLGSKSAAHSSYCRTTGKTDGRDRETDERTLDRFMDPVPHTMWTVSLNWHLVHKNSKYWFTCKIIKSHKKTLNIVQAHNDTQVLTIYYQMLWKKKWTASATTSTLEPVWWHHDIIIKTYLLHV